MTNTETLHFGNKKTSISTQTSPPKESKIIWTQITGARHSDRRKAFADNLRLFVYVSVCVYA